MNRVASLAALVWVGGGGMCPAFATEPIADERPADLIELRIGESVTLEPDPIEIRFEGVLEDSRCPVDMTCVWNGPVRVLVSAESATGERESWVLERGSGERHALPGDRTLYLHDLEPRHHAGVVVKADRYVAQLRVVGRNVAPTDASSMETSGR